jgi:N-sulfoglucosamine sulfohydrolase
MRFIHVFLASVLVATPLFGVAAQPAPPNFVVIIADDMSWDDVGAYGHPTLRTPNLDRLAREGMRFDRAFVTVSSCSPSRASIITGLYPHQTGAEQLHWPLPAAQLTFVELLREAGYWTAAAGKWHLGDAVKSRFDELKEGGGASGAENWVPVLRDRPHGQPFFLWLAAIDPHRPYTDGILAEPTRPEDVVVPPYMPDVPEVRRDLALYYDEVTRMDGFIGQVLDELHVQGVAENTFILFLADNGRPFPRDKTTSYDSGIQTPWIVRWPQQVAAGSSTRSLVSSVDIAPTLLRLANVPVPPRFQGYSFAPILRDPDAVVRDYVFAERNWHDFDDYGRAVRDTRYKYIRNYYHDQPGTPPADALAGPSFQAIRALRDSGALTPYQVDALFRPRPFEELYDLDIDPHEMNNLVHEPAHVHALNRLRQVLDDWREATGDRLPLVRSPDQFDRETGQRLPDFPEREQIRMRMQ